MELIKGVMENIGVEETQMEKALNLDSGLQMFAVNQYPPCPNPEVAMGIPPHTDHGLLTLLMQNGVEGLQVEHNGKWVIVNEIPNSFIVNVSDQLEIFSNGKYKSVMHRAIVNDKIRRLSIAMPHGPSLDTTVSPYSNLVKCTTHLPAYIPMKYKEYMEQMVIQALKGKPILEQAKVIITEFQQILKVCSKPRCGNERTGIGTLIGAIGLLGHAVHWSVHGCVPGDAEISTQARRRTSGPLD
ncbi:hypothetical protein LguiA_026581 [Lonicera macranthoides]